MMTLDKMKDAVHSIEMPETMKSRVKARCHKSKNRKTPQFNVKKWGSVASVMGIVLLLIIGIPFFNNNGDLQLANFTITAHANNSKSQLSTEKTTFDLSTIERDGAITSISGDGKNLIFTYITLNVSGENIDKITYSINQGKFIEVVTLTKEEMRNKDQLLSEKIYHIFGPENAEVFQGIKEIGTMFTVNYDEQNQSDLSFVIPTGDDEKVEDVLITVIVKYEDGHMEQQDILVTEESNAISLTLDSHN